MTRSTLPGLLLAGLGACFKPSIADGNVACGGNGLCPPGFVCGADNRCYQEGGGGGPGDTATAPGDTARGDTQRGDLNRGDLVGGDLFIGDTLRGDNNVGDLRGADTYVGDDYVIPVLTVGPAYPGSPDWNDYIRNEAPTLPIYARPGTPCDGTEATGYRDCIHAGELRRVDVTELTSCPGLTLDDSLGVFEWICDDNGGAGPATFYSVGFQPGMGLANLVDATGFLSNQVRLHRNAATLSTSTPGSFGWGNPFAALPDNSTGAAVNIDQDGAIYVIDGNLQTNGYNVNGDHIALVALPGGRLEYGSGVSGSCRLSDGELNTGGTDRCLVSTGDQQFNWYEGAIGDPSTSVRNTMYFVDCRFIRLHQLTVTGGNLNGIQMMDTRFGRYTHVRTIFNDGDGLELDSFDVATPPGSDHNYLYDIVSFANEGDGLDLTASHFNEVRRVRVADSEGLGITLQGADYNIFVDVVVTNTRQVGMWDGQGFDVDNVSGGDESEGNTFSGLVLANNEVRGFNSRNNTDESTMSHLTALGTPGRGYNAGEADHLTAVQILVYNNNTSGFHIGSPSTEVKVAQVYTAHNGWGALYLDNNDAMRPMDDFEFNGDIWAGNNSRDCVVGPEVNNAGLVDTTCTVNGMEGEMTPMPGGALFHPNRDLTMSFVGELGTDDMMSDDDDMMGQADHGNITDWTNLESKFRYWGPNPSGNFPSHGPCLPGETCRIWDLRVLLSDSALHGVTGTFNPGGACPANATGNHVLTDRVDRPYHPSLNAIEGDTGNGDGVCESGETCRNRFLWNAQEILDDAVGDDDGLCENNEACVYSPHVGAYQGHGPLTAPCTPFVDGGPTGVNGVTLRAYSITGL